MNHKYSIDLPHRSADPLSKLNWKTTAKSEFRSSNIKKFPSDSLWDKPHQNLLRFHWTMQKIFDNRTDSKPFVSRGRWDGILRHAPRKARQMTCKLLSAVNPCYPPIHLPTTSPCPVKYEAVWKDMLVNTWLTWWASTTIVILCVITQLAMRKYIKVATHQWYTRSSYCHHFR